MEIERTLLLLVLSRAELLACWRAILPIGEIGAITESGVALTIDHPRRGPNG